MVNFTGQSKKRVVNLGSSGRMPGRQGGFTATSTFLSSAASSSPASASSSVSYLELAKTQRREREEIRNRERAAATVRHYVERYLCMLAIHDRIYIDWVSNLASDLPAVYKNPDLWVYQLRFLCRWKPLTVANIDTILQNVSMNLSVADNVQRLSSYASSKVVPTLEKILFRCLVLLNNASISRKIADDFHPMDGVVVDFAAVVEQCISKTCQLILGFRDIESRSLGFQHSSDIVLQSNILNFVNKNISNYHFASTETLSLFGRYMLSFSESSLYVGILRFLSLPCIGSMFTENSSSIRDFLIKTSLIIECKLSKRVKINLLVNVVRFLDICEHASDNADHSFYDNISILSSILANVSFTLVVNPKNVDPGDLHIGSETWAHLQPLYSSAFIRNSFSILSHSDETKVTENVLQVISTLLFLVPQYKNNICMLLSITPDSYQFFYTWIKKEQEFQLLIGNSTSTSSISLASSQTFWKVVYTFEELFSYWLIVSNDPETFSSSTLSIDEMIEFMKFLKSICLKMIFEGVTEKNQKLKETSISLLNQLYLKNLRLKFLDAEFWNLSLTFNSDHLVQGITEKDQERRSKEEELDFMDIYEEPIDTLQKGYINEDDEAADNKTTEVPQLEKLIAPTSGVAKLEILSRLPFFVPFRTRVYVFQTLIELDRAELNPHDFYDQSRLKADIRREFLLEDAFNLFKLAGINLKHQLRVSFFNELGGQEAGIDGGGITKEFLTSVVTEGFKPNNLLSLFKETSYNQLYPNEQVSLLLQKKIEPRSLQQEKLAYFRFLGNVIGKCFYEKVLIDISFAPFFLTKWCNANRGISIKNSINDLKYLDEEMFNNLMKLTTMDEKEILVLDLNFTIDETIDGKTYKFNLIENGESIVVDKNNRLTYIHQLSNFKLNQSLLIQTKYFLEGLFEIISSSWLSMFDTHELQMLILGGQNDVNIQDWKDNVEYGGYYDDDVTVLLFWEVVSEMTSKERFLLVKFVTSVSRAPLLGFGALSPKFGIRNAGRSSDRLPTASTCVNLLKLPDYQDKDIIREKLLYAINTDSGFDLS